MLVPSLSWQTIGLYNNETSAKLDDFRTAVVRLDEARVVIVLQDVARDDDVSY